MTLNVGAAVVAGKSLDKAGCESLRKAANSMKVAGTIAAITELVT